MTLRRTNAPATTPEAVAVILGDAARSRMPFDGVLDPESGLAIAGGRRSYAQFFAELGDQVALETGIEDRVFVYRVAELAGVSPADWYKGVLAPPCNAIHPCFRLPRL